MSLDSKLALDAVAAGHPVAMRELAALRGVKGAAWVTINNFGIPNGNGPWATNPHLLALYNALVKGD